MPVFDGLLPDEDDEIVADMLFELSNWHALAKLRMHHDVTLLNLEHGTRHMYTAVRTFANTTCQRYTTHELPTEAERRENCKTSDKTPGISNKPSSGDRKGKGKATDQLSDQVPVNGLMDSNTSPPVSTRQTVEFTVMNSIKYHFLGDYVSFIRRLGTTDGVSSQCVRLRPTVTFCIY